MKRGIPAGRTNENLAALFGQLGETEFRDLAKAGQVWLEKEKRKGTIFRPADKKFPSANWIFKWKSKKPPAEFLRSKMTLLIAYLAFRSSALPSDFRERSEEFALKLPHYGSEEDLKQAWAALVPTSATAPAEGDTARAEKISVLLETAIAAVIEARTTIVDTMSALRSAPRRVAHHVAAGEGGSAKIDFDLETLCTDKFKTDAFFARFGEIQVAGEEAIRDKTFTKWESDYGVLLDVMDGTDVMVLGFNLWSSAVCLYDRKRSQVMGAVVATPDGSVYVAREDAEDVAWVSTAPETGTYPDGNRTLLGCSNVEQLVQARIAFYSLKPANFLSVARNQRFIEFLEGVQKPTPPLRILGSAGNRLLVQLCDTWREGGQRVANIDAIFDAQGQWAHDFVPGAFIALKAGAHMIDLETGKELKTTDLGEVVDNAAKIKKKYVIAGTAALAGELTELLRPIAR